MQVIVCRLYFTEAVRTGEWEVRTDGSRGWKGREQLLEGMLWLLLLSNRVI